MRMPDTGGDVYSFGEVTLNTQQSTKNTQIVTADYQTLNKSISIN
jgi:hypothetical protein